MHKEDILTKKLEYMHLLHPGNRASTFIQVPLLVEMNGNCQKYTLLAPELWPLPRITNKTRCRTATL